MLTLLQKCAPALVKIQHPKGYETEGEFAFDHIIAALDGSFNDHTGHVNLGSSARGYEIEFPPEDFEGDMLGVVLANRSAIQ